MLFRIVKVTAMSDEKKILAQAFLEMQPEAAADILMQHNPEDVISFISDIPEEQTAKVFTYLLPHFTAALCLEFKADTVAKFLSDMDSSQVTAILRHLDKRHRNNVLKHLSPGTRAACNVMLRFSEDRVGAWMSPQIATISHRQTVREALQVIETGNGDTDPDYIYVVNHELHIEGRVHYINLLRADPRQPVTGFIDRKFRTLLCNMKILKAADDEDWKYFDVMPVLNREKQFTGILRHVDLRKGLTHLEARTGIQQDGLKLVAEDSSTGFAGMYIHTLLVLFSTIASLIETDFRS